MNKKTVKIPETKCIIVNAEILKAFKIYCVEHDFKIGAEATNALIEYMKNNSKTK